MSTGKIHPGQRDEFQDGEVDHFVQRRRALLQVYRDALLDDFVPWWQEHSIDEECGGYFSRLERDGKPYSFDKDVWMLGRQIWMFAHLYNTLQEKPLWREIAGHGVAFLRAHAFRPDGEMYFRLSREGRPKASVLSLFTQVFAAIALAEYSQAAKDESLWQEALAIYRRISSRLGQSSHTPLLGYPLQCDFHLHSHDLCTMTIAAVFQRVSGEDEFLRPYQTAARSIIDRHWKPARDALLENVGLQGEELFDIPEGRLVNPGHALESAWMMMELAAATNDRKLLQSCIDIIIASLNMGWDEKYGGIRYMLNVDGTPCHSIEADCKLWWPHGEALYATLFGSKLTGRADLAQWYEKVHEYTFANFPDREFGEWFGYLNRDGSPIWTAKANGWKGFFHVPRVLHRCCQILQ